MVVRNDAFILRNIENTYILVACKRNCVGKWLFHLNTCGAMIWESCKEPISVSELLDDICAQFCGEINKSQRMSLEEFIMSLKHEGLLLEVL